MKKPTKTKAVKAVKYWGYGNVATKTRKVATYFAALHEMSVKPVALLPMDAASVESMVVVMAQAIYASDYKGAQIETGYYEELALAALAAIGIKGGAK